MAEIRELLSEISEKLELVYKLIERQQNEDDGLEEFISNPITLKVGRLTKAGKSKAEIMDILDIGRSTVQKHRQEYYKILKEIEDQKVQNKEVKEVFNFDIEEPVQFDDALVDEVEDDDDFYLAGDDLANIEFDEEELAEALNSLNK